MLRPEQKSVSLQHEIICNFMKPGYLVLIGFGRTIGAGGAYWLLQQHCRFLRGERDQDWVAEAKP